MPNKPSQANRRVATRGSGAAVTDHARKDASKKVSKRAERVVSDDNESVSSEPALQPPVNDSVEDNVNDVADDVAPPLEDIAPQPTGDASTTDADAVADVTDVPHVENNNLQPTTEVPPPPADPDVAQPRSPDEKGE